MPACYFPCCPIRKQPLAGRAEHLHHHIQDSSITRITMGESRTELIAWLNDLLGLGYTKVEQCGTGAAYAQIIDSIYGNVPMGKLNWAAKMEYEFLGNYKVLQDVFKKNKIAKPIPVERLTKCKMQDNLEWLQWSKVRPA